MMLFGSYNLIFLLFFFCIVPTDQVSSNNKNLLFQKAPFQNLNQTLHLRTMDIHFNERKKKIYIYIYIYIKRYFIVGPRQGTKIIRMPLFSLEINAGKLCIRCYPLLVLLLLFVYCFGCNISLEIYIKGNVNGNLGNIFKQNFTEKGNFNFF